MDDQPTQEPQKQTHPLIYALIGAAVFFVFAGIIGFALFRQFASPSFPAILPAEDTQIPPLVETKADTTTNSTPAPTLTSQPEKTNTIEPGKCLGESTIDGLNIREEPDGFIKGCCLADGEEVDVIDEEDDWYLIIRKKNEQRGWVSGKYIDLSGDCDGTVEN